MNGAGGNTLFGIYVHWPFCASKCPYCDFNSHVRDHIDHDAWRAAYLQEIAHYAALTPGRTVTSVFFGGGTPSLMQPATADAVIDAIARHWTLADGAEVTLEANPTSVEAEKFRAFRTAGVNRVSVGVQAMNDSDLKFLGRAHSAEEARRAIGIAARTFDRYSFDLIYARPEQDVAAWRAELAEGLALAGGHMSLYQLTIEQGTPFHLQHARGEFSIPDGDLAGEFYEATQEAMDKAGMPAYEISNHAVPGQESLHNMTYWRYGDYAGIGPGAHGRLGFGERKAATRGHRAPEIWMKRVAAHGHGAHPFEDIVPAQRFAEALMMGLRLREGVDLSHLAWEGGKSWRDLLPEKRLAALVAENLLVLDDARLRPTPAGMQRLNGILQFLL